MPGNLAVILRNAPALVREGMKVDAKAFLVMVLVTKNQKGGAEGMSQHHDHITTDVLVRADVKDTDLPPRWPPVLPRGSFQNATFELTAIDATSISSVVNRLLKVDVHSIVDKKSKEVREKTLASLVEVREELTGNAELPEVEWTRMRKLEFQDLLKQRMVLSDRLARLVCRSCPDFDNHVSPPPPR